jgi:hypothetical protein
MSGSPEQVLAVLPTMVEHKYTISWFIPVLIFDTKKS